MYYIELTSSSDKLLVFSGVAKRIQQSWGNEYVKERYP